MAEEVSIWQKLKSDFSFKEKQKQLASALVWWRLWAFGLLIFALFVLMAYQYYFVWQLNKDEEVIGQKGEVEFSYQINDGDINVLMQDYADREAKYNQPVEIKMSF